MFNVIPGKLKLFRYLLPYHILLGFVKGTYYILRNFKLYHSTRNYSSLSVGTTVLCQQRNCLYLNWTQELSRHSPPKVSSLARFCAWRSRVESRELALAGSSLSSLTRRLKVRTHADKKEQTERKDSVANFHKNRSLEHTGTGIKVDADHINNFFRVRGLRTSKINVWIPVTNSTVGVPAPVCFLIKIVKKGMLKKSQYR